MLLYSRRNLQEVYRMYNQELKEQFVSAYSKNESKRKSLYNIFEAVGKYEEKLSKDFCQMNEEELGHVLQELMGYRARSKNTRGSSLRAYARWCFDNQIPGATQAMESVDFDRVGLDKMRRQSVASPQHLQRYLDSVFEKESEETVDVVYRCFFWLAYMGVMKEEDALSIDVSDVDFEDMAIHFNGKDYPFYREAVPSIKKCATLESFRYVHPNYDPVLKERAPGTKLLRGLKDTRSLQVFRNTICRKERERKFLPAAIKDDKSLDLSLSFDRVWLSGRFFVMLENERSGMSVDFTYLAEEFMEGKEYNLSSGRNLIGAKKRQVAGDYLRDYEQWKLAYSV